MYTRFSSTPDSSLIEYGKILFRELHDKADTGETADERLWYRDAASLIGELMLRFDKSRVAYWSER